MMKRIYYTYPVLLVWACVNIVATILYSYA